MVGENRKKFENNIVFWLTVVGVPIGISIAIFAWLDLDIKVYLPISILIGLLFGLIAYTFLLRADLKDKDQEIKELKTKLRRKQNAK